MDRRPRALWTVCQHSGMTIGGAAERDRARKFVREFAQNAELRETWNFPTFAAGLAKMQRFDARYLCTGHGGVVRGDIPAFLDELIQITPDYSGS